MRRDPVVERIEKENQELHAECERLTFLFSDQVERNQELRQALQAMLDLYGNPYNTECRRKDPAELEVIQQAEAVLLRNPER